MSTGNAERALTLDIHSKDMDVTRTLHLSKKKAEILIWACAHKPRKIVFIEAFRICLPIEAWKERTEIIYEFVHSLSGPRTHVNGQSLQNIAVPRNSVPLGCQRLGTKMP